MHRSKTKKVFKHAKAVTNVSGTIGKVMEKLFALQDVRTIHNTVDSSLFNYSNSIPDPKFKFIHVSTLKEHQKNSSGILETTAKLTRQRNDFELVIVGPASEQFKRKAMSLGLATVIKFTGEIPYTEVAKQMQEAAVLILFSRYENFPCVIVEALCCGLPGNKFRCWWNKRSH
ncbi:MAG: glycosyltransferase [Chitinophagaceae bacterium]